MCTPLQMKMQRCTRILFEVTFRLANACSQSLTA